MKGGSWHFSRKPDFSRDFTAGRRDLNKSPNHCAVQWSVRSPFLPPRTNHDHRRIPNTSPVRSNQFSTSKLLATVLNVHFNSISTTFLKEKKNRHTATSTGSTNGKKRHGGVTTDIFVDGSMWQAVPCKFWVQRLVFGDVA